MQWREAATLMLISRLPKGSSGEKFNILMMKRSSHSKFMPNAAVFPGGVVDKSDFNGQWLDLLHRHKKTLPSWQPPARKPMIYEKKDSNEELPREVAFRLNAIRETFEETGILLLTEALDEPISEEWRHKVHDDPKQFITMCTEHRICPDIWSLYEWSDWLTPLHLKTKSRFDTMFFLAVTDNYQGFDKVSTDGNLEVSEVQFKTPTQALKEHFEEKIWLAPPQFYEISRLAQFSNPSHLKEFAENRSKTHGIETWFPVMAACKDGAAALYPGDEAYPENPDMSGTKGQPKIIDVKDNTLADFHAKHGNKNRMEIRGPHKNRIICNFPDPSGHVEVIDASSKL